jgi:opacity protein-like surface antigen
LSRRILSLVALSVLLIGVAPAQQFNRFNFNFGGGVGGGMGDVGKFTGKSYQGGAGGGVNFNRLFGVDAEYMYYNLSFTGSVVRDQHLPDASGRLQSFTLNGIFTVPTHSKWGVYAIAGAGIYRRSVEARSQGLVPGTVCQPAWALWGITCTNNLITEAQTLSSRTVSAAGYNFGGGLTYRVPFHHAKVYVEGRYHHANTDDLHTSVFPVSFGLRW